VREFAIQRSRWALAYSFTTARRPILRRDQTGIAAEPWLIVKSVQIQIRASMADVHCQPDVVVSSFAFKTGAPEANLVIDVRFLPDPRPLMEEIPALDGKHGAVEDFLRTRSCFDQFFEVLKSRIAALVQDLRSRGCHRAEFAFGCTGGQHRSVFAAERLANWLREELGDGKIHVMHRELSPRCSTATDFSAGLTLSAHLDTSQPHSPASSGGFNSPSSSSSSSSGPSFNSPSSSSSSSSGPSFKCTYHPDSNCLQIEEDTAVRTSLSCEDMGAMLGCGLDRVRALRDKRRKLASD